MGKIAIASDTDYKKVFEGYRSTAVGEVGSKFSGVVRSGQGMGFMEGDVITLPDTLENQVLDLPIAGSTNTYKAIIVKITDKNGVARYQPFSPNTLSRRTNVLKVDTDGKVIGNEFKSANGTAAEFYQGKAGQEQTSIVEELINLGKDIKVTKVEPIKTYVYRSTNVIDANIYTFDFVN